MVRDEGMNSFNREIRTKADLARLLLDTGLFLAFLFGAVTIPMWLPSVMHDMAEMMIEIRAFF